VVVEGDDALGRPCQVGDDEADPRAKLARVLIKIGAKVVSHGRYVIFQMAEVAVPRQMFKEILMLIARLRAPPAPT
jgi:hypothetical protein